MTQKYDVIVAGSGPAGGTAAYFLGEAGKKVLILEKEKLPRYKTCGGAVSLNVLKQFPFSFEPVIESRVKAITFANGEKMVTVPLNNSALVMVMRDQFDAFLARHAKAELLEGTAVKAVREDAGGVEVETVDGQTFEADYLVAADGANSTVAHSLNLRRQKVLAGAIEIEATVPETILSRYANRPMLIFGDVGIGYLWVFPKADHISVGAGAFEPKPQELQKALEKAMGRLGIVLQGQLRHGHPVPIYQRRERISTRRTLLTGDAAGLVDPFTGEGIRFAIKSGRMAAECLLAERPGRYAALVDRRIGANHRLGTLVNPLLYSRIDWAFQHLMRDPVVNLKLTDMIDDRLGYGRLLLSLVGMLPRLLLGKKMPLDA
jgi:geranylgeranyl reductase family protein